ncbi:MULTISPECIES: 3-carboxy-cis,cis-muconate cycloisomerase [Streptacidiphilus]|uniref:3-carboxy-cis,cis-muconate cycloisomerase n=1 Tax=Streptacidiphilus cavernicola TaxID=3342716 RepID=A0ABV6UHQ7_9ACTN|nr:3-carboxy-cis,cis-muconate cycloisomerase [Streptacidiphilus jeojiense]
MTSPNSDSPNSDDVGLLAPVSAGSEAESATGDRAFLQAMLDAEAALVRAQAAVGLAPASAARAVTEAARAERFDPRSLALRARAGGNPVIPLVADLAAALPEAAAARVHQGATSQDIMDSAMMLIASRTLAPLLDDLAATADTLAALAAEHRATPMPGRTLTQHAVPTTFGLKAAGWRALVLDAHARIATVRASLPAQLGGAAGTLAAFHAYAEATGQPVQPQPQSEDIGLRLVAAYAAELGLAEPQLPWHVLRTPVADLGAALAFTAGALGKLAADVLVLSRTEIAELAEGTGGGSSAMPHKSNPVRATLIAAAARQVPALAAILLGSMAAEDERPAGAWHAEWQPLRDTLRLTGGAARDAAELVAGLKVNSHLMWSHLTLTDGLLVSERLSTVLAPLLGRDRARTLLVGASRRAAELGIPLDEALRELLDESDELLPDGQSPKDLLPPARLRELTDPTAYLGSAVALTDRALRRTAVHKDDLR